MEERQAITTNSSFPIHVRSLHRFTETRSLMRRRGRSAPPVHSTEPRNRFSKPTVFLAAASHPTGSYHGVQQPAESSRALFPSRLETCCLCSSFLLNQPSRRKRDEHDSWSTRIHPENGNHQLLPGQCRKSKRTEKTSSAPTDIPRTTTNSTA
ncbi:hypothetical protein VTI74DRAFT_960 [Chaetomium olivicolor]